MSASRVLRALVVGVRGVGTVHINALSRLENAEVVAVAGASESSAQQAARRLGVQRWSGDYRELVSDPLIDVVHVCTPNDLHLPVVRAAVAAGKHVVCEKPLAAGAADAAEMVRLARNAPGQSFVCYKYRYLPVLGRLRALVASGSLGTVHAVRGHYLQSWKLAAEAQDWRCDPTRAGFSPVLLDIGTHLIDLVEHVLACRRAMPFRTPVSPAGTLMRRPTCYFKLAKRWATWSSPRCPRWVATT